jgi:cobalamin biosynthesis Co2+ chelatase CbiK
VDRYKKKKAVNSLTAIQKPEEENMKKKLVTLMLTVALGTVCLAGCGGSESEEQVLTETVTEQDAASEADKEQADSGKEEEAQDEPEAEETEDGQDADKQAADLVASLIDAIYVQERTDDTDMQCAAAKAAWDALTDEQKELVEGENADPDYFGRDTGDASKDDPRNQDEIGENEILVVSFGTSFNDSRVKDIKGIEDALAQANPDWSVRRAFTAQIIINHIQARDEEKIDNVDQALERAVNNGVKNLVIQPTHLMHGAEYDELTEALESYKDKFESVKVAEPLLGEVGEDATVINEDKKAVAEAVTAEAVKDGGYDSLDAAKEDGVAFVFMGHGTSHTAKVSYSQMQTQMNELGYENVFIGTVEGEPEETACENVIEAVKEAGYKKVVLRPLMVVAGDHANNDMAGDDEDSWKSLFEASGNFDSIETQIAGLGGIEAVQKIYVEHTAKALSE